MLNLYWDTQNQRLVSSLYSTAAVTGYTFVLRDLIPVSLCLVTPQTSLTAPYAVTELGAGQLIKFGAKATLADADFDVSAPTWVSNGSALPDTRYTADISLNTAELITAIADADTITLEAEFTIQNADGSHELSTQFDLTVNRDVIVGTEGVPTVLADVSYVTPAMLLAAETGIKTPTGGLYRIKNGALQIYNPTQSKYHTLSLTGAAGSETLSIGAGEA
jgi:hypothetical protein